MKPLSHHAMLKKRLEEGHRAQEALQNLRRDFFGPYDYAGTHEVAEFLGVRKQVVSNHAARRLDFPQPVVRLAMGPIYRLCDIRDWKRAEDIRRGK